MDIWKGEKRKGEKLHGPDWRLTRGQLEERPRAENEYAEGGN